MLKRLVGAAAAAIALTLVAMVPAPAPGHSDGTATGAPIIVDHPPAGRYVLGTAADGAVTVSVAVAAADGAHATRRLVPQTAPQAPPSSVR